MTDPGEIQKFAHDVYIGRAVEDPTIENIMDALREFVKRWDTTPVEFVYDGEPVEIQSIDQDDYRKPVVITLARPIDPLKAFVQQVQDNLAQRMPEDAVRSVMADPNTIAIMTDALTRQSTAPATLSRDVEPPVGTWVRDRFGATSYRQPAGWGQPGVMPFGKWEAMWDARGPYVVCGPWGADLPTT